MSRKLMVSLSVSRGSAVGVIATDSAMGGAATVGNNWAIFAVAVGLTGGTGDGDGVSVGRICSGAEVFTAEE
jgi:hypothetical protein